MGRKESAECSATEDVRHRTHGHPLQGREHSSACQRVIVFGFVWARPLVSRRLATWYRVSSSGLSFFFS